MGNRPINRRPWRKKPWAKKRPTRWNATTTPLDGFTAEVNSLVVPIGTPSTTFTPPLLSLIAGQADVEPWADDQEITVDRIVGTIHIITEYSYDPTINDFGNDFHLKAGILVNEEVSQDIDPPGLKLWEQETMEDYEWMWLWSGITEWQNGTRYVTNSNVWARAYNRIDLDIRNRRKVGQSDELNLYMAYAPFNFQDEGAAVLVSAIVDLREIMLSR